MQSSAAHSQDRIAFPLWALAALTTSFAIVTGFSIGIFIAPLAAASIFFALRRSGRPSTAGLLFGVGVTTLSVGLINLDELSCPQRGQRIIDGGRMVESCGSFEPLPWLIIGGLLMIGSAITEVVRRAN